MLPGGCERPFFPFFRATPGRRLTPVRRLTRHSHTLPLRSLLSLSLSQPKEMLNSVTLTKSFRKVCKAIKANTESNFYRPDLTKALLAKWSLISKSQKKTKK